MGCLGKNNFSSALNRKKKSWRSSRPIFQEEFPPVTIPQRSFTLYHHWAANELLSNKMIFFPTSWRQRMEPFSISGMSFCFTRRSRACWSKSAGLHAAKWSGWARWLESTLYEVTQKLVGEGEPLTAPPWADMVRARDRMRGSTALEILSRFSVDENYRKRPLAF